MNKKEAVKIVGILSGYYPDRFRDVNEEQLKSFIEIWHKSFTETPFIAVEAAVMDFIQNSTDSFMPNIGKIKEILNGYLFDGIENDMEAFQLMIRARRRFNSCADGDTFEPLSEPIKRAIGGREGFISIGTLNTESEAFSIEKTNFMRTYRAEIEKMKRDINRPEWLKGAIKTLQGLKDSRSNAVIAKNTEVAIKEVAIKETKQLNEGVEK